MWDGVHTTKNIYMYVGANEIEIDTKIYKIKLKIIAI